MDQLNLGVDRIAQRRLCRLHCNVAQQLGMGLNTVPLVIIIGEVEQFKVQRTPNAPHDFWVQASNLEVNEGTSV